MALMNVALNCVRRGWSVFPCIPRTKRPLGGLVPNGVLDASNDEAQVRAWWAVKPDANVGVACGPSGLSVVDCDHGNRTEDDARAWMQRAGLPETYTVHTGRRINPEDGSPEYGVQLYYAGTMPSVGEFVLGGGTGQVKSLGGYVMAAGSIHPDSGETYEVLIDSPIVPLPDVVRSLKKERKPVEDDEQPITENRNIRLTSIAGKLRNAGLSAAALEAALLQVNAERCVPPLDDDEVQRIAGNAAKWEMPEPDPVAVISGKIAGQPDAPVDWRKKYHSFGEIHETKPPTFLIRDFLQEQSITGLAAPVGQRKSLVALNITHACLTGEPLFGYFPVEKRPERVLYLCPEMGIISFADRLKKIGLESHVGKTLFCRTMGSTPMDLTELTDEELQGSVVIIDTAVRFLKGDENSPKDMSAFARSIFRLSNAGALAVILLHHSTKATKDSPELTLENTMRGSGELGAFLTTCWATKLRNPNDEYKSASYLKNVKPRDFECKPFDVVCDPTCRMSIVGVPGDAVIPIKVMKDKDGKEKAALEIICANASLSNGKLSEMLADHGITRSPEWVRKQKHKGATHTSD